MAARHGTPGNSAPESEAGGKAQINMRGYFL